jgi:hypothetical protein
MTTRALQEIQNGLETTHQDAASSTGNGTAATVNGFGSIAFQITGTFTATVTFEASVDGTNYETIAAINSNGQKVTSATATGLYRANIAGYKNVRTPVTWTSGTSVTVKSLALPYTGNEIRTVEGIAAENAAASGNPVGVGGRYDSSDRTLGDGDRGEIALDSKGNLKVAQYGSIVSLNSDGSIADTDVKEYRCLSTDTKIDASLVPLYSTLIEMDTENVYYSDGTDWQAMI